MTFQQSIRTVLSKYATFSGRAARSEYWWWVLFVVGLNFITTIIDATLIAPGLGLDPVGDSDAAVAPLSMVVGLLLFLPGLAVSVRRLHDLDKSGWWLLVMFVPLVGVLLLIFWFASRGTKGPNRFGREPHRDSGF